MLSRSLRNLPWWRLPPTLLVCVAFLGEIAVPLHAANADQAPSLTIQTPEVPLAALADTSGNRIEKQATSQTFSLRKPDRVAHLVIPGVRDRSPRWGVRTQHVRRTLSRRQLHAVRLAPRAADDPSSLLLS